MRIQIEISVDSDHYDADTVHKEMSVQVPTGYPHLFNNISFGDLVGDLIADAVEDFERVNVTPTTGPMDQEVLGVAGVVELETVGAK